MVINTNMSALVSADNLQGSQTLLSKSLARLSSGSKIVSPSDDAAGLAVASRLDAQIQRLNRLAPAVGERHEEAVASFIAADGGTYSVRQKSCNRSRPFLMMSMLVA